MREKKKHNKIKWDFLINWNLILLQNYSYSDKVMFVYISDN